MVVTVEQTLIITAANEAEYTELVSVLNARDVVVGDSVEPRVDDDVARTVTLCVANVAAHDWVFGGNDEVV